MLSKVKVLSLFGTWTIVWTEGLTMWCI